MPQSISILVKGKVQGVYFRKHTLDKAGSLGLTGFVKNLPDGNVSIQASGDAEKLQALAVWCRKGPPGASVTGLTVTNIPYIHFDSFRIER